MSCFNLLHPSRRQFFRFQGGRVHTNATRERLSRCMHWPADVHCVRRIVGVKVKDVGTLGTAVRGLKLQGSSLVGSKIDVKPSVVAVSNREEDQQQQSVQLGM